MRKTNRKTWLKITMQPDGSAVVDMSWSNVDVERKVDANKELIVELCKMPGYEWLREQLAK